jgi:hypothetical protein
MPISFRLERDEGLLDWSYPGGGGERQAVTLDKEEAMIVAVAEMGAALRAIAHELHRFHEATPEDPGAALAQRLAVQSRHFLERADCESLRL